MNVKRIEILLTLALSAGCCYSQAPGAPKLSHEAEISVITLGPWQGELYSAFGHSAFRVNDPALNLDGLFDYGVFSFNQPNFYINFARGHLNYRVGYHRSFEDWKRFYIESNRFVHEQVLNLTPDQEQKVFDYLFWNMQPGNEYYSYDYFYNNCATKMRDVLKVTLKEEVSFDSTFITTNYTIRELTDLYLAWQPWGDLGIDICLGLPMDKVASPYEYMFIPDYIEDSFDHASIMVNGARQLLVREKVVVYESTPETISPTIFHPWIVFGLLMAFVLFITYRDWRGRRLSKWLDLILFSVTGLIGVLLMLLWTATDHHAAARNLNILWAMPLHLAIIPFYVRNAPLAERYFKGISMVNIVLLVTWAWIPQQLNVFLIPVVLALTLRAVWIGYFLTSQRPRRAATSVEVGSQ